MDVKTYLKTYIITTLGLVYILNLPTLITGEKSLVKEHYGSLKYILLEIFVIYSYIFVNSLLFNKNTNLTIVLTSLSISTAFMIYYQGRNKGSFFERWFKKVGYKGVLYDVIIVTIIKYVYTLQIN